LDSATFVSGKAVAQWPIVGRSGGWRFAAHSFAAAIKTNVLI